MINGKRTFGIGFILLTLFCIGGFIIGICWKAQTHDSGIAAVNSIKELYNLNPTVGSYFNESEATNTFANEIENNKERYLNGLLDSSVIVIASATEQYTQYPNSYSQVVSVESVIKGNQIEAKQAITVFRYYGLSNQEGKVTFKDVLNVMQPGNKYILFLEPSKIDNSTFYCPNEILGRILIDNQNTKPLNVTNDSVYLVDVKGNDFFCSDEKLCLELNDLRRFVVTNILSSYETSNTIATLG